jgi:hypothetical protein
MGGCCLSQVPGRFRSVRCRARGTQSILIKRRGEKGERRREKGDDFPSKGTDIKKTRHTTCVTGESSVVDAGS